MGTAASAALGMVAGSLLFQGIGSMMGHHNSNASNANPDHASNPPGGGQVDTTDRYGDGSGDAASGYAAEDFDTSDSGGGGGGDSGGDIA